jgi:hypothetical protein
VIYDVNDNIRSRLSTILGLNNDSISDGGGDSESKGTSDSLDYGTSREASLVLFPSGSDAEFLPLVVAMIRSKKRGVVYSYVTAAGEVGSGTPNASGGRHFSPLAPNGTTQTNNGSLNGIEQDKVVVVQFKPRSDDGSVDFQELKLVEDIRSKLNDDNNSDNVVVLHVVCGSKTGLVYPSLKTVDMLNEEFKDRLVVVVDACQLRCQLTAVVQYTERGYITLVTGSKFYTGPPFSGAVVFCKSIETEIETHLKSG